MLKVNDVQLADRISVPSERKLTDAGQMHVPCKFARTGTQLYTAKQLGLVDREENEVITVHREAADVFAVDSMESFRSSPVTIGHPFLYLLTMLKSYKWECLKVCQYKTKIPLVVF